MAIHSSRWHKKNFDAIERHLYHKKYAGKEEVTEYDADAVIATESMVLRHQDDSEEDAIVRKDVYATQRWFNKRKLTRPDHFKRSVNDYLMRLRREDEAAADELERKIKEQEQEFRLKDDKGADAVLNRFRMISAFMMQLHQDLKEAQPAIMLRAITATKAATKMDLEDVQNELIGYMDTLMEDVQNELIGYMDTLMETVMKEAREDMLSTLVHSNNDNLISYSLLRERTQVELTALVQSHLTTMVCHSLIIGINTFVVDDKERERARCCAERMIDLAVNVPRYVSVYVRMPDAERLEAGEVTRPLRETVCDYMKQWTQYKKRVQKEVYKRWLLSFNLECHVPWNSQTINDAVFNMPTLFAREVSQSFAL